MASWQGFTGLNRGYVLELYERFRRDPTSVDPDTRALFERWVPPADEAADTTREAVLADWNSGFTRLLATLRELQPDDLLKDVYIRGERHSVVRALDRAMLHLAYHVGQIVFLAKHLRSSAWRTLTIPKRRTT